MNQKQQELYEKLLKKVNEFCLGQAAEDVIEAIDDLVDSYECTGQTPLQAFEILKQDIGRCYEDEMKIVETALKALEIFKRNCLLSQYPDGTYELAFTNKIQPTEEDTEILKEVLK